MCSSSSLTVSLVIVSVILVSLISSGSAIKCYSCSTSEKNCQDEFNEKDAPNLVTCSVDIIPKSMIGNRKDDKLEFKCHKVSITGKDDDGKSFESTMRGCIPKVKNVCDIISAAIEVSSNKELKVKSCHTCEKDKCNGAGDITASLAALFIAITASFFLH